MHGSTTAAGRTIETTGGAVCGAVENGMHVFSGIPYGASTAGTRRFLPPRPRHWPGVLAATRLGARSPQVTRWTAEAPHLVWNRDPTPTSEDCLALNVWSPADGPAGLPVMVFLHGGGTHGSRSCCPHTHRRSSAEMAGGPASASVV